VQQRACEGTTQALDQRFSSASSRGRGSDLPTHTSISQCPLGQKSRQPEMQPTEVSKSWSVHASCCSIGHFLTATSRRTTRTRPLPRGRIRRTARARMSPRDGADEIISRCQQAASCQGTCRFSAFVARLNYTI
jgi:hypothetical protein